MAEISWEEPRSSWREEYLVARGAEPGRPVCMVCGDTLSASGPAAAREHILQQHPHSLGFTLEEKRNILEAWSEEGGAELLSSPAGNGRGFPGVPGASFPSCPAPGPGRGAASHGVSGQAAF